MSANYFKAYGVFLPKEIASIKKGSWKHPIYEAFSNSWESLKERFGDNTKEGRIVISFYIQKELIEDSENQKYIFEKIEVKDNGLGLSGNGLERLINLRDNRKGAKNQGTGRVQYLHFFDTTVFESVNKDSASPTEWVKRILTLSKSSTFLSQNSILREDLVENIPPPIEPSFSLSFHCPLDESDESRYAEIDANGIKKMIVQRFLALFCENRESLPKILIQRYMDGNLCEENHISQTDIPDPASNTDFTVPYSTIDDDERVVQLTKTETFSLKTFKFSKNEIEKNGIFLVSKGETSSADTIPLDCLGPKDEVLGNRYLFLLTGEYIDKNDTEVRGQLKLITRSQLKKERDLFSSNEAILLEDVRSGANRTISNTHPEISIAKEEKSKSLKELQQMFLLNPDTVDAICDKINANDSDEDILRRIYESEAKIEARQDAEIKQQVQEIGLLDPSEDGYQEKLKEKVNEFVRSIPLKNRTALSQYVARRKLVLEIFEKILNKELEKLRNGGRIGEEVLHNLIFQQSSTSPDQSDLWLINEEYIYFRGASENRLLDMEYQGKKIFKADFSKEEERYLNSLRERRLTKRPDILLFPEEGKCIIIEFKAPDVNASEHISQVDFYANLIRNYTLDEMSISSFYGYLIGESIEDRDLRGRVSRFEYAPRFDFWFRPSERVVGFDGRSDGSIYMEVLKYSSLLERAKLRNRIFINKLEKGK